MTWHGARSPSLWLLHLDLRVGPWPLIAVWRHPLVAPRPQVWQARAAAGDAPAKQRFLRGVGVGVVLGAGRERVWLWAWVCTGWGIAACRGSGMRLGVFRAWRVHHLAELRCGHALECSANVFTAPCWDTLGDQPLTKYSSSSACRQAEGGRKGGTTVLRSPDSACHNVRRASKSTGPSPDRARAASQPMCMAGPAQARPGLVAYHSAK